MSLVSRMRLTALAVCVVVCGANATPTAGCTSRGEPAWPRPVMGFQDVDRRTSVAELPTLRVIVNNSGAPVGNTMLAQIATNVRIRTWPEMVEVPSSTSFVDVGERDVYQFERDARLGLVETTPNAPLAPRWYVYQLTAGHPDADLLRSGRVLADGSHIQAFRVGSEPSLLAMMVCEPGYSLSVFSFSVMFSEEVVANGDPASLVQLTQLGTALACTALSPPGAGMSFDRLVYECPPTAVDRAQPVVVNFVAGIAGLTGQPLIRHGDHPSVYSFVINDLPGEPGCRGYTP